MCCILHLYLGRIQRPHPNRVRQTSIFVAVSGLVVELSEDPKAGSGEPAEGGSELQPWPWILPVLWECPGRDVTQMLHNRIIFLTYTLVVIDL